MQLFSSDDQFDLPFYPEVPPYSKLHGSTTSNVAQVLLERYLCEGPADLLTIVTVLCRSHLKSVIISDTSKIPIARILLADALRAQFELQYDLDALDESIQFYSQAHSSALSLPLLSMIRSGLSQSLFHRFLALGDRHDCEVAVNLMSDVQSQPPVNDHIAHANVIIATALMRSSIGIRRIIATTTQDMTEMLERLKHAQRYTLPGSLGLMSLIAEMRLLGVLAEMTRDQNYVIVSGLQVAEHALQICPQDAEVLRYQILLQFWRLHDIVVRYHWDLCNEHMDTAILLTKKMEASRLTTRNTLVQWESHYFGILALRERAVRDEDLSFLEGCIDALKVAILTSPNKLKKYFAINEYAHALGLYCDRSGRISSLDELIAIRDMGPEYIEDAPSIASNIAEAMLIRARISSDRMARTLIDEAQRLCQRRKEARSFIQSATHGEKIGLNLQLITASRMCAHLGLTSCLTPNMIVRLASEGLELATARGDRRGLLLAKIEALIEEARMSNIDSFLTEAYVNLDLELTQDFMSSSVYAVELLAAKADVKIAQWDILCCEEHLLSEAWNLYQASISHLASTGHAKERFEICLRWAKNAADRGHKSVAFKAYVCAVHVLPRVVFLGEDVIGRIEALRQVNGLASACMSASLAMGDAAAAVELLELTRGILWLQWSQSRVSQCDSLPGNLRQRFMNACLKLEQTEEKSWTAKRRAAEEVETIKDEIRAVPKFERFLLPPSIHEIVRVLREINGLAAILNSNDTYCEAIILGGPEGHVTLRLTGLNRDRIRQLALAFANTCSGARLAQRHFRGIAPVTTESVSSDDPAYMELLSLLWSSIVRPILERMQVLAYGQLPINYINHQDRLRLWWCPVGALGALPLHAAGKYDAPSLEHIGNYAVSSYVPTLSTLHRILVGTVCGTGQPARIANPKMLLVSQPESMGLPSLPHAKLEVDSVRKIVPSDCVIRQSEPHNMTVEQIIDGVSHADALHFACHSNRDKDDPLNSGFTIEGGRLTLAKLMGVKATYAQLAYLSACESAGMDENRPDEALNLASTMIALGFRSVIATLWEMDDIDGPFMADRIYRRIFCENGLDLAAVPYAVIDAVKELRESGAPPSRWPHMFTSEFENRHARCLLAVG